MPSENKKPQVFDLSVLLKGLNEAGVEFVLVGGVARFRKCDEGGPTRPFHYLTTRPASSRGLTNISLIAFLIAATCSGLSDFWPSKSRT